ncbi:uncharacterized protein FPRN_06612 [Fusarium proliferatum]|nr:uncharacterized protein FPRN_06612 [Fusarium proliferatum]
MWSLTNTVVSVLALSSIALSAPAADIEAVSTLETRKSKACTKGNYYTCVNSWAGPCQVGCMREGPTIGKQVCENECAFNASKNCEKWCH